MVICAEMIGHTDEPAALCNPTEYATMFYEINNRSTINEIERFLETMKDRMSDDNYTDIIERQNYCMGAVLDIIDAEFAVRSRTHTTDVDEYVSFSFEF